MTKFKALKRLRENTNSMLELEFYINKIYDEFEEEIDKKIIYLEDSGWYEHYDKDLAIKALYALKEKIV